MQTRGSDPAFDYITRTFVGDEPAWIVAAREQGERQRAGLQMSAYEGYLLQWLLRISGAAKILEIGSFMGVSAMWMAGGLPAHGRITSLENGADYAALAKAHVAASPHKNAIEIIHANAHQWIAETPATPQWDWVFIDAEKLGYADYLDAVLPRMNPRGWIVGDNSLLFGALAGEELGIASPTAKAAMLRFNETLADSTRFESVLLPTPEGLTVARLR